MRLPDLVGVLAALVVGGLLVVFLLASALGQQPALATPAPPTIPPIPTPTRDASATASPSPSSGPSESGTPEIGLEIGQRAPDFEVTLTDGSVMSTSDFDGPMWINFMATWCPQCADELPMMQRFQRQLEGQMTLLLVDVGEDNETVRQFVRDLDVDLPVGVDDGTVQAQWGAYALPVHYWLDADGIVREIVYGGAPEEIFLQAITAVLPEFSAEETPEPTE